MNTSFSAAKDFNINLKHVRREFEPELKAAGDHMLSTPWSEIEDLSKDAQFALAEVMHLSHATHVQQQAIPAFVKEGNSCVVEAKTGSGKTLAFVVPLTERLRRQNNHFLESHKHAHPFLSRNICAFIVSPSRVLAQQTFIVGRTFSCRYPYSVKYILVDKHVESLETTAARLMKISRSGGFIAVGTVADVHGLNEILMSGKYVEQTQQQQQQDDDEDDNTSSSDDDDTSEDEDEDDDLKDDPELQALMKERRKKMQDRKKQEKQQKQQQQGKKKNNKNNNKSSSSTTSSYVDPFEKPVFACFPNARFTVVVDEADVVLKDPSSYSKLFSLCQSIKEQTAAQQQQLKSSSSDASNANNKNKSKNTSTTPVEFDFGLFGATATSVDEVAKFMDEFKEKVSSTTSINIFKLSTQLEADAADLRNLYEMVEPHNVMQSFVHILNMHHSKKHFVFFNNISVLNFVHRLLVKLSRGTRPVLRTPMIFALHEGMKDAVRFEQFGKFVRYSGEEQKQIAKDKKLGIGGKAGWGETAKKADKKLETRSQANQLASSMSTGAILLCTDEAAFGLDVRDVDYVIHFEPPPSIQSFIHRCGRVARMGMTGTSILLLPETQGAKQFLLRVNERLAAQHAKNYQNENQNENDDEEDSSSKKPMKVFINKLHMTGARAPITSNIAAFVEEIATDAEEQERQNIAAQTSSIHLPSRRSRHVEEQIEQTAQKYAQHRGHGGANSIVSSSSANNDEDGGGDDDAAACKTTGAKLVKQAVADLAKSEEYTSKEATAAIFSRY